ncbi:MAG: hypothetical protein HZB29_03190 [Nitrospinae bacterium]|nr:hypothetical protein [Nitrospinota bacterium]
MSRKRPWGKTGILLTAALALCVAGLLGSCGGALKSESVPNAGTAGSMTLTVSGNVAKDSEGRYMIRANGKDTIEFIATVKGLSSLVGFYVPTGWGTFGGGTLSNSDGYTYFQADKSGKVRAQLMAGTNKGRFDLRAKSMDVEVTLPLSFEFATCTILPSTQTIHEVSIPVAYAARGCVLPMEWFVSLPLSVGYYNTYDDWIDIYITDVNTITTGQTVSITAIDSEGNIPTAASLVLSATQCTAATITVSPTAPAAGVNNYVSVIVVDPANNGASSVDLVVSGFANGTLTLTQWGGEGVFQGNYTILAADAAVGNVFTFTYSGTAGSCTGTAVSATATVA